MWIDRTTYENLTLDNAKLREESRVLNQTNYASQTTLDWFRVRVSQLERERAQLLHHFMGLKIEVPEIVQRPQSSAEALNPSMSFEDVGDTKARELGVGWDTAGLMARS